MMKLTVFALLLLLGAAAATNVNSDFRTASGGTPDWKFDTGLQFTTSFTMTSGNTTFHNGDTVCSGSTVTVTPSVNAVFATGGVDVISGYPSCGGGYCPAMIPYTTVTNNRPIKWLSSSTWDDNHNFAVGGGNDFSQDQTRYSGLGGDSSFSTEPVTYTVTPGNYVHNQEGGAGVFCKGNLQVLDGTTSKSSNAMPSSAGATFTVTGTGSHTIKTQLSNVQCFASVVKHPEEKTTHPEYFYFYLFAANAPSIPASSGSTTMTVNVQNSGGSCAMHETSVTASGSISSSDDTMVHVRMHNDGDAILVTAVGGSNAGYSVSAFPTALCSVLGFPTSICPADNGFNEPISPSATKDLYVLVHNNGGASGGTTLTFTAQTVSEACGGASTCTDNVDLTGPITCAVTPSSLSLGSLESYQFQVACNDLANNPISCAGDNWTWADGLSGGFFSKTSSDAEAYTTSPPGSSGSLQYTSGLAECKSLIDVVTASYQCAFVPPTATMSVNASKYFELHCFENGNPHTPDNADYDLTDGLTGTTSNDSTSGVDYTAPSTATSGTLRGHGLFSGMPPGYTGAVALAPITVNGPGGNGTNTTPGCTNPNGCGPGGPGSTAYCTIGNGPLNVFPGYTGWLPIKCGQSANESCGQNSFNVQWSVDPSSTATISGNNVGVSFTVTGGKGTMGTIIAVVNSNGTGCTKPFFIGEPTCAEES